MIIPALIALGLLLVGMGVALFVSGPDIRIDVRYGRAILNPEHRCKVKELE